MRTRAERPVERPGTGTAGPRHAGTLPGVALRRLARRLEDRRRELLAKIDDERYRVETEALPQLDGETGDDVDRASVNIVVRLERELIDRCVSELEEIAAARERIARGAAGICSDCGEPIDAARLDVNPIARRCTECQARSERAARIASG